MADNLKPIPNTVPLIKVSRRREGHQGRNSHGQSEEHKENHEKAPKSSKSPATPKKQESKELDDFHKLLEGRH